MDVGAGRTRVREIQSPEVGKLEQGLALDVVNELDVASVPFCDQERFDSRSGVAQGRSTGRVAWLLDNIETAQFGLQRQRLVQT
jgi:Protein of unknown function (DUF2587)